MFQVESFNSSTHHFAVKFALNVHLSNHKISFNFEKKYYRSRDVHDVYLVVCHFSAHMQVDYGQFLSISNVHGTAKYTWMTMIACLAAIIHMPSNGYALFNDTKNEKERAKRTT